MSDLATTYDAFISYSHDDQEWVCDWLLPRLEAAGLRICVDFRDFYIGVPRLANIERAIDSSRHTLLILTPARLASEWSEFEELLSRSADPAGRQRRVLPLMLKRCRFARRIDILIYADFTQASRWDAELARVLDAITGKVTLPQAIAISASESGRRAPFILPQLDISTFTGRQQELNDLQTLLVAQNGPRVCTIVGLAGTGGMGKSALACHFAQLCRAEFPDGVIGLRVDGKDLNTIAREFARHIIDLDPDDERDGPTLMQEVFGGRRALLIFDNADSPAIRALRPGGELCAVIVTTRDRLLPSMLDIPSAGKIDLASLPKKEALHLLEQLLGAERVAAESEAAGRIIDLVGGLPLALQIIGAALLIQPGRSLAQYAASLNLTKLRIRNDEHMDVRASFALSLELLDTQEIDFFACLSVCAKDGFALRTAMATGDCDEETAYERLSYLYRMSLLNYAPGDAHRFVLHPLIRQFAEELARERSLHADAEKRHACFFVELVKSENLIQRSVTAELAMNLSDVILAAEWLQRQGIVDSEFVNDLLPFFQRYGYWQEAITLTAGFLVLAERQSDWRSIIPLHVQQAKFFSLLSDWPHAEEALNPVATLLNRLESSVVRHRYEAMWLTMLGVIRQRQGRREEAIDAYSRSTMIEAQLGNRRGQAIVLNTLGSLLQDQGRFSEAESAFRRSYSLLVDLGDKHGQAMVLNSLGGLLQGQGHFAESSDVFELSHRVLVELDDRQGQAMVLNSLGGAFQRQGHFAEAVDAFRQSAAIEQQIGNLRGQAMVLNSLGSVLQRQGRFVEAVNTLQQSATIAQQIGDLPGQAKILNSLGSALQRQGHDNEAIKVFEQCAAIEQQLGDLRGQAMVLNSLGGALQRQGHFAEALGMFQNSYSMLLEQHDQPGQAMILNSLGGVYQRLGRFAEAETALRRSITIAKQLDDQLSIAIRLNSLGGLLKWLGRFAEAADTLKQGLAIAEHLEDLVAVAMILNSLGGVLQRQGHFAEAEVTFRRSITIAKQLNDQSSVAKRLNSLGGVLQRQGRFAEAIEAFQQSYTIFEGLGNQLSLAKVYTALGKALLSHGDATAAIAELRKGFELDERLRNQRGVGVVGPSLIRALTKLGRHDEALDLCRRALALAPQNKELLELLNQIRSPQSPVADLPRMRGAVKRTLHHHQGYLYGFIVPDDNGPDIYFRESDLLLESLPMPGSGVRVELDLELSPDGRRRARNVKRSV